MRKIVIFLLVFITGGAFSQNKQLLYDFAELPQTLLLNPGANTSSKFYIGMPLLSGISFNFGSSGFSPRDIFEDNNVSFNDKVSTVLQGLNNRDHLMLNSQIEVLNVGFRYKKNTFFSFGFYQEIDGILYYPKDLITLATEGNANFLNKSFDFSQLNYNFDVTGVLHFGINKRINKKLTVGGRFKIYSSAANLRSTNNSGTFTTIEGTNTIFTHRLENINLAIKTAGVIENDEYIRTPNTYLKNSFFGSNLGVGIDIGFTNKISRQLEISVSLLDIGFVSYKENIKNTTAQGNFAFEGLDFDFSDPNRDYWTELDENFRANIPFNENDTTPYTALRPAKLNASLKYSFKEVRNPYCYNDDFKDYYKHAVGGQLFSVFRPLGPQFALTGFYETAFTRNIKAKVTYTADRYSFYNVGAATSFKLWKINFYALVDNILQFTDIAATNGLSAQLGFNLIF